MTKLLYIPNGSFITFSSDRVGGYTEEAEKSDLIDACNNSIEQLIDRIINGSTNQLFKRNNLPDIVVIDEFEVIYD